MACDLAVTPLTDGFVAPAGPEAAAALKKLDARAPLGSTDMAKALSAIADGLDADSTRSRARADPARRGVLRVRRESKRPGSLVWSPR